ncbi:MAG TPA: hypothetical protein VLR92_11630, partial [Blastocatellia bacterium]|nr:hypothetical protein [Blastocatellia bacterium]
GRQQLSCRGVIFSKQQRGLVGSPVTQGARIRPGPHAVARCAGLCVGSSVTQGESASPGTRTRFDARARAAGDTPGAQNWRVTSKS